MVLIFLFPAVIISILLLSESLASWSGESRISGLMLYLVWAIPLFAVIYIIGDYFRAIHRVLESTLIREVLPSALFLIGLMLIFFLDFTDLGKIILTYSMSLLPVAALAIAWAVISMRQMNGSSLNIKHNDDSKRSILVFAFSSAILQALWIFRERVTLFLVSHEMTAADVSLYFVSIRFLLAISLIRAALNSLLSPKVASLYNAGKIEELRDYYTVVTRWTFLSVVPFVVGISYFGGDIAAFFFGSNYAETGSIIMLVFVLQVLSLCLGPSSITLQMSGKPQIEIALLLLSLPVIIGISKMLMHSYQLIGAVIGMYGVLLVFDGLRMMYIKKVIGIEPMTMRNAIGVMLLVTIWIISYLFYQELNSTAYKFILLLCSMFGIVAIIWNALIEDDEKRWFRDRLEKRA